MEKVLVPVIMSILGLLIIQWIKPAPGTKPLTLQRLLRIGFRLVLIAAGLAIMLVSIWGGLGWLVFILAVSHVTKGKVDFGISCKATPRRPSDPLGSHERLGW